MIIRCENCHTDADNRHYQLTVCRACEAAAATRGERWCNVGRHWFPHADAARFGGRNVLALFDDDPDAQVIVEGDMDDWSAEELRAYTGLSQTAYDSKRRLIRRRLNKAYPGGWKP